MKEYKLPTADEINACSDYRKALDLILNNLDDAMWAGHDAQEWPDIEEWLNTLDPTALTIQNVVSVLSFSLPMKKLPARVAWVKKAKAYLSVLAPERLEALMRGLE